MRDYPNWTSTFFTGTRWSVRKADAFYVSKAGNDLTNDGSPRKPYKTIARAVAEAPNIITPQGQGVKSYHIVVSSGTYTEGGMDSTRILSVTGDGLVTLDGFGAGYVFELGKTLLSMLVIQNYRGVFAGGNAAGSLLNCRVLNCPSFATSGNYYNQSTITNCLFVNSLSLEATSIKPYQSIVIDRCTFVNSPCIFRIFPTSVSFRNIRNCTLGPASTADVDQDDYFDYNNVRGSLVNSKKSITTPITLAQWRASNPGKSDNCINTVEDFTSPTTNNYTLMQSSALRNASTEGAYVGCYGVGIDFGGLNDAETLVNARWDTNLNQFVPVDSAQSMSVEFVTKDTGRIWVLKNSYLTGIEDNTDHQTIDATYSYENVNGVPTDTPSGSIVAAKGYWVTGYDTVTYAGSTYANDTFLYGVTGETTYTTTGAGKVVLIIETPNIRLMELKYSSTSQGDCDSRLYKLFAINQQPTYNVAGGRSNGDPAFNYDAPEPLAVRWLKVRITILPNSIA